MRVLQFAFGRGLIVLMLAVETLVLIALVDGVVRGALRAARGPEAPAFAVGTEPAAEKQ